MSYVRRRETIEAIKVSDALASSASEPAWLQTMLDVGRINLLDNSIEVATAQGRLVALPDEYLILDNQSLALSIMTADRFSKLYEPL